MILLVDMDAFFASVEQAHHPHLRAQVVRRAGREMVRLALAAGEPLKQC